MLRAHRDAGRSRFSRPLWHHRCVPANPPPRPRDSGTGRDRYDPARLAPSADNAPSGYETPDPSGAGVGAPRPESPGWSGFGADTPAEGDTGWFDRRGFADGGRDRGFGPPPRPEPEYDAGSGGMDWFGAGKRATHDVDPATTEPPAYRPGPAPRPDAPTVGAAPGYGGLTPPDDRDGPDRRRGYEADPFADLRGPEPGGSRPAPHYPDPVEYDGDSRYSGGWAPTDRPAYPVEPRTPRDPYDAPPPADPVAGRRPGFPPAAPEPTPYEPDPGFGPGSAGSGGASDPGPFGSGSAGSGRAFDPDPPRHRPERDSRHTPAPGHEPESTAAYGVVGPTPPGYETAGPGAFPTHPGYGDAPEASGTGAFPAPGATPPGYRDEPAGLPAPGAGPWGTPGAGAAPAGGVTAPAAVPPDRIGALLNAVVAVALFGALLVGGRLDRPVGLAACVLVQAAFVAALVLGTRRPGPAVVAVVGLGAGLAADAYAGFGAAVSLAPFGYVLAAGLLAGAAGQLARSGGRTRVTDSLASTMYAVIGTVAVPSAVMLTRHEHGAAALTTLLGAAGAGVVVARLVDTVWHSPRASAPVARGVIGVVAGGVLAATTVGYAAGVVTGLPAVESAVAGLVMGLAAVLSDVGVSFGSSGLELSGEPGHRWPARFLLGPAFAATAAAPVAYVLGWLVLLPRA